MAIFLRFAVLVVDLHFTDITNDFVANLSTSYFYMT